MTDSGEGVVEGAVTAGVGVGVVMQWERWAMWSDGER